MPGPPPRRRVLTSERLIGPPSQPPLGPLASAFSCPSGQMLVLAVQQLTGGHGRCVSGCVRHDSLSQQGRTWKMKIKVIALVPAVLAAAVLLLAAPANIGFGFNATD